MPQPLERRVHAVAASCGPAARRAATGPLRTLAAVATALLFTVASAQAPVELRGDGYRLQVPAGWAIEEQIDGTATILFASSPDGEGGLIAAAAPLDGQERAAYQAQGLAGLADLSTALVAELPGVQRGELTPTTVAGLPAMGFAFQGGDLGGRFVYLVADDRLYVLGSVAAATGSPVVDRALDGMIASFALAGAAAPAGPGADDGATSGNPLAPAGNPLAPAGNPLDGAANPLDASPFVGRFAGDGVALELARGGEGYVGSLTFQGRTYPVQAREVAPDALAGTFVAGTDAFAFDLVRDGDGWALTTGTSRYALR